MLVWEEYLCRERVKAVHIEHTCAHFPVTYIKLAQFQTKIVPIVFMMHGTAM